MLCSGDKISGRCFVYSPLLSMKPMIWVVWLRAFACFAQFLFASRGVVMDKVSTAQKNKAIFRRKCPCFAEKSWAFARKLSTFSCAQSDARGMSVPVGRSS